MEHNKSTQQDSVIDLIEESRWFHGGLLALFGFLFRLPYLRLCPCFYFTSTFYTPEKPIRQRAFRAPTYSYIPN